MDSTMAATMDRSMDHHVDHPLTYREKAAPIISRAIPVSIPLTTNLPATTAPAPVPAAAPPVPAAPAVQHGVRRSKTDGSKKTCPYPVDPFELSRRLQAVLFQQQRADYAARAVAGGCLSNRPPQKVAAFPKKPTVYKEASTSQIQPLPQTSSSLPVAAQHRRSGSSGISSRLPSGNYATKTNTTSSGPYVPQEAAYQFTSTATASGPWRPAPTAKQPHRTSPPTRNAAAVTAATASSADAATVTTVKIPDAQPENKPIVKPSTKPSNKNNKSSNQSSDQPKDTAHQEQRPSFTAQHAYKDALSFPKDSDNAYKCNRKILDWAKHTADAFHQERSVEPFPPRGFQNHARRISPEHDAVQQGKVERGEEWKEEWSVVSSPVDPPTNENRRVDWTQKDEEAQTLTCEGAPPKQRSGVRRPKSLWTLRLRADGGASGNEKVASTSPTMAMPPKSLRTTKSMLFSLFKNSN